MLAVSVEFMSQNIFLSLEAIIAMYGSAGLFWFLFMHLKNVCANRTTNEQYKITELRQDYWGKVLSFKKHLAVTEDKIRNNLSDFKRFKFEDVEIPTNAKKRVAWLKEKIEFFENQHAILFDKSPYRTKGLFGGIWYFWKNRA